MLSEVDDVVDQIARRRADERVERWFDRWIMDSWRIAMSGSLMRRNGVASLLGGVLFVALFSTLTLVEGGYLSALDVIETHWLFHIVQAPVYFLLGLGVLQLGRVSGARLGRLGRVASVLALVGFAVGTIAGAIVPVIELGFGHDTAEGVLEAVVHLPEFLPYTIGTFLLGIAIVLSGVVSRDRGVLLAIGAVAWFVIPGAAGESIVRVIPAVLFGVAWVWLGRALLESRQATARQVAYAS